VSRSKRRGLGVEESRTAVIGARDPRIVARIKSEASCGSVPHRELKCKAVTTLASTPCRGLVRAGVRCRSARTAHVADTNLSHEFELASAMG